MGALRAMDGSVTDRILAIRCIDGLHETVGLIAE